MLHIVRQIGESRRVLALDVVELHPDLDRQDRTALLARDVILTVAGAQAHSRAGAPAGGGAAPRGRKGQAAGEASKAGDPEPKMPPKPSCLALPGK